jgi:hypothetical protein
MLSEFGMKTSSSFLLRDENIPLIDAFPLLSDSRPEREVFEINEPAGLKWY